MQQQADPQHALDPLLLLNASPVTCIALLTAQEESLLLLGSKGAVFVAVWVPRLNQPVRRVTSITLTPELQPVSFIHCLQDDDEPKTIRMLCTCGSVVTLTCASGTVTLADIPVTVPLVDGRLWWCGFSLSDGADALLCNGSSKVYRGAVEERRGSRVPLAEIGLGDEACEWQLGSYRDGLTGLVDGNREGVILLIVDARSNPPIVTVLCNRELRSAASAFANPMLTGAEDSPVRVIALERTRDWGTFMTSCGVVENGDHRMRIVFGTATTPQLDMVDVIEEDAEEGEVTPRISCTALRHVPSEASSTSALVLLSSATLCASQVRDLHQQSVEYILAD